MAERYFLSVIKTIWFCIFLAAAWAIAMPSEILYADTSINILFPIALGVLFARQSQQNKFLDNSLAVTEAVAV